MNPDMEKYLPLADRFDLSHEEKEQFIHAVWNMMQGFVDRAFQDDPVQTILLEERKKRALDSAPVLELHKAANNVFKANPLPDESEER